ncbi:MAG: PucR family transcriptional regulator ligand-binding domain-containing protein [Firmicutes bacterium]|nr:PucR family transcriptional regulator ligand-binding domain-containing protein [Bacillota bacterium]
MADHSGYINGCELLALSSMKNSRLLSDEKSLCKRIKTVNVIGVPDIKNWTKKHEFLLTTGYEFKDEPLGLEKMIADLSQKGVTGIGVKPKRFIESIPRSAVDAADKYGMLLIEVDCDVVFSEVIYEATQKIVSNTMQTAKELQIKLDAIFSQMTHSGDILESIAVVEEQIGHEMCIINADGSIIRTQTSGIDLDFFTAERIERLRAEAKDGLISFDNRNMYVELLENGQMGDALIAAMENGKPFTEIDIMILKNVSQFLILQHRNQVSVAALKNQYKNRFVLDWVTGVIKNPADIVFFANNCGYEIDVNADYCVAIMDIMQGGGELDFNKTRRVINSLGNGFYVTLAESRLILVAQADNDGGIKNQLTKFRTVLKEMTGCGVSICAGGCKAIGEVSAAYKEAMNIYNISKKCGIKENVITYEMLGIFSILSLLPEHEEVERYKQRFILPLIEYDRAHNTNLTETLERYFKNRHNAKQTANEMYVHYNTLLYRLDKIKKILDLDIDDSEIQIQMQIALKLMQINVGSD